MTSSICLNFVCRSPIQNNEYGIPEIGPQNPEPGHKLAKKDDKSTAEINKHSDKHQAQPSDALDRLGPKLETDEIRHSHGVGNGKLPAMNGKPLYLHANDEVNSLKVEDLATDTPKMCPSETHSRSGFHHKFRRNALSFSCTSLHDVTPVYMHKKSLSISSLNSKTTCSSVETHACMKIANFKHKSKLITMNKILISSPSSPTHNKPHFFYHKTLECNDTGLEHTIDGHNITIRIPQGAIAEGENST